MKFNSYAQVKVKSEGHGRDGQAGVVIAQFEDHPEVEVKFDSDGQIELMLASELEALS